MLSRPKILQVLGNISLLVWLASSFIRNLLMFDQVLGQELYILTWPGCANNVQSGKELGHHQPVQELLAGHVRNVRSGLVNPPAIIRI